jgi:hypothetical protein
MGPECRDMLTWKANSRTQRGRLAHVLSSQTISAYLWQFDRRVVRFHWRVIPSRQDDLLEFMFQVPKEEIPWREVRAARWMDNPLGTNCVQTSMWPLGVIGIVLRHSLWGREQYDHKRKLSYVIGLSARPRGDEFHWLTKDAKSGTFQCQFVARSFLWLELCLWSRLFHVDRRRRTIICGWWGHADNHNSQNYVGGRLSVFVIFHVLVVFGSNVYLRVFRNVRSVLFISMTCRYRQWTHNDLLEWLIFHWDSFQISV